MNILVIDDDDGDLRVVSLALKKTCPEHALVSAGTLAEGMDRLRQGGIDLVLLDLGLPDSHGLETVDRVCRTYADIPIVVLTGLNSEGAGLEALRRGATDYLVKDKLSAELLSRTLRYSLERKRLEQRLVFLASHDPLTGALNRRAFEEAVNRAVARARRGRTSALVLLDVDRLKRVNDTLGHAAGDDVLVNITKLIQLHLREEDVLARVGGDEFAALLEGATAPQAHTVADRIRAGVADWSCRSELAVRPTLSIGLLEIDGRREYEALVSEADNCLYQAKRRGRDQVAYLHPPQASPAAARD